MGKKVASVKGRLAANGQAVWLNADIVPGPGRRSQLATIPGGLFLDTVAKYCPGVPLSLGWSTSRRRGEKYLQEDCKAMVALYNAYTALLPADAAENIFRKQSS